MDHDRSSGEGVGVQEYTCIKLKVLENMEDFKVGDVKCGAKLDEIDLKGRHLFLVAATLRPETMYGQTNCFVGVDIQYGIYAVSDTEAWMCTERSARNMQYQHLFEGKELVMLGSLMGRDIVGTRLEAPLAGIVYVLPMEGVLEDKGTGIVTSVPSDSPDDYITVLDLAKKAAYYQIDRKSNHKYYSFNRLAKWVDIFPIRSVIKTEKYGDLAAKQVVEQLKIVSQKDKIKLAEAKDLVYKEGFYHGTMCQGEFSGLSVQVAKPLVKQLLLQKKVNTIKQHHFDRKMAFVYCEQEGRVITKNGDECVVSLTDQWYLNYGQEEWKQKGLECLERMELYSDETRNNFLKVFDWLGKWACSRSFGLGSRVPWDKKFLIESLSDSTIYMAYYTVAHLLQGFQF